VIIEVPGHLLWPAHRVATSGHYTDSLETIMDRWSLADLADAWDVCEALDAARAEAVKGARS